ncbi:MAG TPA: carbon monoxide dehydrogenase subunit G [Thermoanaerobaculia bacterium]|nr:carbon monoxide dehydrogenase subunit G [Thermoanaerobaculia bacterium]
MNFKGTVSINAPREKVWKFLTSPEELTQCAPGLESLEVVTPNERFRAVASIGFGAVKVTFKADAVWMDVDPPNRARMKVSGKAPGSMVDATSEMVLSDGADGATVLDWSSDVTVVGAIASLAARLMGTVTQKLTGAFFQCVRQKIEEH